MMTRAPALTFERLGTALLFLGIAVAACFSPAQNDTWWHLRAGQDIWALRAIDLHDRYSHTVNGTYWPNHEWLSQVVFYAAYHLGGLPLLTFLAAAFVVGAWWLVWRLTPGGTIARLLLFGLAIVPSSIAWSLRPQVVTLFLMAATLWLLSRDRLAVLPAVFLVWANLHGGVMLGFTLLAGGALAQTLETRRLPFRLAFVALLCVLATMATPLGASLWLEVPAALARSRPYGIMEWRAPRLFELVFLPFWILAAALVGLVVATKAWQAHRLHGGTAVWAALAMLPLALSSGRNVPPFVLLAVPAVALLWREAGWSPGRLSAARREHPRLNAAIFGAMSACAAAAVGYAWIAPAPRLGWHPLPPAALSALADCPDRLYNRYDEGGFVIWFLPDRKVFLDSRQDPYPSELVHAQIAAETSGDYKSLFERFAIRCALVGTGTPVAQRLLSDGWDETYSGADLSVLAVAPGHE
jgi:hypothetical protein